MRKIVLVTIIVGLMAGVGWGKLLETKSLETKDENIDYVYIDNEWGTSYCSCASNHACTSNCYNDLKCRFGYYTSEAPVTYTTHVYIMEKDDVTADDEVRSWESDIYYYTSYTEWSVTFYNVNTGYETCCDNEVGGVCSKDDTGGAAASSNKDNRGEFYCRVWIESAWWDEDESSYDWGSLFYKPVDVADFWAEAYDGKIGLYWETSLEEEVAGWNIYKAADGKEYERLNDALIPPYQYFYEYIDTDVENGVRYCYSLEAVELSGARTAYGPVCATPSANDGDGDAADLPDAGADDDAGGMSATGGCGWW